MAQEEKKRGTWWVLYPLEGMSISDREHDLDRPMFGDATIISGRHISHIVSGMKMRKAAKRFVTKLLQKPTFEQKFPSHLAIRRSGVVQPPASNSKVVRDSIERAYELGALLGLVLLAKYRSSIKFGFVQQSYSSNQPAVLVDHKSGRYYYGSSPDRLTTLPRSSKPITISRRELNQVLGGERFVGLAQSLLPQKSRLARAVRNPIAQASIRLWDAVQSVTASAQLLGAVTSMEILLSNQEGNYETTKRRLGALIGETTFGRFDADKVFDLRHWYVHQGKPVENQRTALKAIGLALSCLLRYAEAALIFPSKSAVLQYLDFVHKADYLVRGWKAPEREAFQTLMKHVRKGHKFAFIHKGLNVY